MSHLLRWGGGITWLNLARLTKYSGLTLIAVSVLAVIVLNVIISYSNSKIQAGAESPVTLATNVTDEASISLSIHSATDSCDTSTSANPAADICLQIPDGGGIAVGRHTISVVSNSYAGYSVTVEGSGNTTDMSASDFGSDTSSNNELIKSTNATIANPATLNINTWGIAIPNDSPYSPYDKYSSKSIYDVGITNPNDQSTQTTLAKATFGAVPPKLAGETIMSSSQATGTNHDGTAADSQNIYYGANVEQFFRAGSYSEEVVYTATVNLPPTPTNLSVSPTTYEFGSCNDSLITIEGTNLSSAYEVYLQKSGTSDEANRLACTNLNLDSSTNNQLTCNIPTSRDEVELNTTYDIYVISQAASPGILQNAFTYSEPATGISVKSTSENIIVDYDENLIPVIYVGYDGNGGGHWESLTKSEIASNTDNWFNYTNKQWANAVTVTKESLSEYQDKHTTIDNNDVLGYWVYIPRYAYEVQRRDATDKNVDPQNFDIVFETANDTVKTPAKCTLNTAEKLTADINSSILYQDCIKQLYGDKGLEYPGNDEDLSNGKTTWATHPAFTWGDTELNGIWVGKFETTGKISAPTVKPNQHANINEYIGNFYLAAKSIGKEDKCNVGGGSSSTDTTGRPTLEDDLVPNSHNLATTKSHMLKNSEWGAITYLAHSKYGAGINTDISYDTNVQRNSAYPGSSTDADGKSSRYGITGCGPAKANETSSPSTYTDGTALSADVIESPTACSQDLTRAYNGSLGVLSSTTNNGSSDTGQGVYGVYGLSGGAGEYVMGNRTTDPNKTYNYSSTYMKESAVPPYVDLYVATPKGPFGSKPSWSSSSSKNRYNYDVCTFETCGGTATYETTTVQSVSSNGQSWGGSGSTFVTSGYMWSSRGCNSNHIYASPFYTDGSNGYYYVNFGSRAALLALPAGQ